MNTRGVGDIAIRQATAPDLDALTACRAQALPLQSLDVHTEQLRARLEDPGAWTVLLAESESSGLCAFLELALCVPAVGNGPENVHQRETVSALYALPGAPARFAVEALIAEAQLRLDAKGVRELVVEVPMTQREPLDQLGFSPQAQLVRLHKRITCPDPHENPVPVTPGLDLQQHDDAALLALAAQRGEEPVVVIHTPGAKRWRIVHTTMAILAVICVANTDLFSPDLLRGAVLPILDVLFVLYFAVLFVSWRYGKRTQRGESAGSVYDFGDHDESS